jgi:hypothetical protein
MSFLSHPYPVLVNTGTFAAMKKVFHLLFVYFDLYPVPLYTLAKKDTLARLRSFLYKF